MGIRRVLSVIAPLVLLAAGCGEEDGFNAPPVGSGSASGNPPATTTGGDGGSGGADDSTSGDPGCTVDCPEPEGGTCPGHAEWNRGVVVWGLWESGSGTRSINPVAGDTDDPKCSNDLVLCVPYEDPSDLEGPEADLLSDQMDACAAMTSTELAALGLTDYPSVGSGWTLIHHFCETGPELSVTYQGQPFTAVATGNDVVTCTDDGYKYDSYCSAETCPIDDGGTGTSTGTGGADSTTGADSTAGSSGEAFDCSDVDKTNVSFTTTGVDKKKNLVHRTATISGGLVDVMVSDPYSAMYYCGEASISPSTHKIHTMASSSILLSLGLMKNDVIVSVDGETDPLEMYDAVAGAFLYGGTFEVEVQRRTTTIEYDVTVVP